MNFKIKTLVIPDAIIADIKLIVSYPSRMTEKFKVVNKNIVLSHNVKNALTPLPTLLTKQKPRCAKYRNRK